MKTDLPPTPPAERTPLDSEDVRAREQAEIDAKMALLPDYGDEAFPSSQPKRAKGGEPGPLSVVAGGFAGGILGNVALGFAVLALRGVGAHLHGPGVLAIVVALVVLVLVLGTWPKRVWLVSAGFVAGLVVSFAALSLFLGPVLEPAPERSAPASGETGEAAPALPSDGSAS